MSDSYAPTHGIKPAATIGIRPNFETPLKGAIEAADDTSIIAAPGAGKRIVVHYLKLWCPSSNSGENTVTVKWGSTGIEENTLAAGEGIAFSFESGYEWVLPANTALVLTTSSAEKVEWSVRYWIERVA